MRKLLAISIAFLIWFYVGNIENPVIAKTIQIPIELVNLSNQYQGELHDAQITLIIEGRSKRLQSVTPVDFKAEIDLSNAHIGENISEINIKAPFGIKVLSKQPNQVLVNIKKLNEKVLPVTYTYHGQLKDGIKLDGEPKLSTEKVKIYGPNDILSTIHSANIDIDLGDIIKSTIIKKPLIFYDLSGNIVSKQNLRLSVSEVEVSINTTLKKRKKVEIKVPLKGELSEGYKLDEVIYNPKEIYIDEEDSSLESISELSTRPIFLDKIDESQILNVDLDVPKGIKVIGSKSITVNLKISKQEINKQNSNEMLLLPIKVIGEAKNGKVVLSRRDVMALYSEGKKPTEAYVDISNLDLGNYKLELTLNGNASIENNFIEVSII